MARVDDGFSTKISIGGVYLWEKEVTPPGIEGGGENDTTTMRNTTWRTKAPKRLKTLTPSKFTAAYDPIAYNSILAVINVNSQIVVTFADNHTLTFWGWVDKFVPNAAKEGEQPTAEVEIIPSNQNNSGVEVAPVYA